MKSLTPAQAAALLAADQATLIDVRSIQEHQAGAAQMAQCIPLDTLTRESIGDHAGRELIFICQRDPRSRKATQWALDHGIDQVAFVEGGSEAWFAADLPWVVRDEFFERYVRHLSLPEIGEAGQRKLNNAHVVMVGAGGLGSPIGLYLAASGVGRITLIDDDHIERSNLQRQVIHRDSSVGTSKAESARDAMLGINPSIRVKAVGERLTAQNAHSLLGNADLVIDGADNFAARHLINQVCVERGIPWVYGAILQFDGHVSVFDVRHPQGDQPCYRCLFPEAPDASFAPNCTQAGVLGVLPGLIGIIQATEALKLLLGIGQSLAGWLLQVDALGMNFKKIRLRRDPGCPQCGTGSMR